MISSSSWKHQPFDSLTCKCLSADGLHISVTFPSIIAPFILSPDVYRTFILSPNFTIRPQIVTSFDVPWLMRLLLVGGSGAFLGRCGRGNGGFWRFRQWLPMRGVLVATIPTTMKRRCHPSPAGSHVHLHCAVNSLAVVLCVGDVNQHGFICRRGRNWMPIVFHKPNYLRSTLCRLASRGLRCRGSSGLCAKGFSWVGLFCGVVHKFLIGIVADPNLNALLPTNRGQRIHI